MTFPTGWNRRCPLVIQASGINSDLTNFPVLLTEDTLPLEMFDADGSYPTLSGGGDIRFSFDKNGSTQLACEVVTFITGNAPANGKAEIWVKVPCLSSSINTIIYVWYSKAGETQPASNNIYGSENVWNNNYKGVWHLNKNPSGTVPQELDSTTNNNDGTSNGSMALDDLVDGEIGKALNFDGSDDYIEVSDDTSLDNTNQLTVEAWIYPTTLDGNARGIISKRKAYNDNASYVFFFYTNDNLYIDIVNADDRFASNKVFSTNTWYHIVLVYDGTLAIDQRVKLYVDSDLDIIASETSTSIPDNASSLTFGILNAGYAQGFNGIIDEVRISNTDRSAAWISACYSNQNDPSTFVIEETPEYVGLYYFSGYVFEQNNPVNRKLCLHNRFTGVLVDTTTSSGDGYYYMKTAFSGSHYIVCLDDDAGIEYNDLIIGSAFPTMVSG